VILSTSIIQFNTCPKGNFTRSIRAMCSTSSGSVRAKKETFGEIMEIIRINKEVLLDLTSVLSRSIDMEIVFRLKSSGGAGDEH